MRVLVTGAGGFVGRRLAQTFSALGHEVIGLRHAGEPISIGECVDIRDEALLRAIMLRVAPEAVVHLAAISSVGKSHTEPTLTVQVNVAGTLNLLTAATALPTRPKVLIVSSGEVYGRLKEGCAATEDLPPCPVSPYAASKLAAEVLALQFGRAYELPVVIARPFNHLGAGQAATFVIPSLAEQIVEAQSGTGRGLVLVGNLAPVRDFTHVQDVVDAYAVLLERGVPGGVYNVGSGHGLSIQSLLDRLLVLAKCNPEVRVDPHRLRPADIPWLVGDPARLHRLGWVPRRSVDEALAEVLGQATQALRTKS